MGTSQSCCGGKDKSKQKQNQDIIENKPKQRNPKKNDQNIKSNKNNKKNNNNDKNAENQNSLANSQLNPGKKQNNEFQQIEDDEEEENEEENNQKQQGQQQQKKDQLEDDINYISGHNTHNTNKNQKVDVTDIDNKSDSSVEEEQIEINNPTFSLEPSESLIGNHKDNYFTKEEQNYYDRKFNINYQKILDQSQRQHKIKWRPGEQIGFGACGRVVLGLNSDNGKLMAVKQVHIGNKSSRSQNLEKIKVLKIEIALLRYLKHKNIVRYFGYQQAKEFLNIFLEFVPGGSIASLVSKYGKFNENMIRTYTTQILEGLEYLHAHKVVHRDIKGANILVDNNGVCKLADFGSAKKMAVQGSERYNSLRGTPNWMAPEVIKNNGSGRFSDIWSVGCTVLEMATGKPPFSQYSNAVTTMFHIAQSNKAPPIPSYLSADCKDFLKLCLKPNPQERPNVHNLLKHPFLKLEKIPTFQIKSDERSSMQSSQQSQCNQSNLNESLKLAIFEENIKEKIKEIQESRESTIRQGKDNDIINAVNQNNQQEKKQQDSKKSTQRVNQPKLLISRPAAENSITNTKNQASDNILTHDLNIAQQSPINKASNNFQDAIQQNKHAQLQINRQQELKIKNEYIEKSPAQKILKKSQQIKQQSIQNKILEEIQKNRELQKQKKIGIEQKPETSNLNKDQESLPETQDNTNSNNNNNDQQSQEQESHEDINNSKPIFPISEEIKQKMSAYEIHKKKMEEEQKLQESKKYKVEITEELQKKIDNYAIHKRKLEEEEKLKQQQKEEEEKQSNNGFKIPISTETQKKIDNYVLMKKKQEQEELSKKNKNNNNLENDDQIDDDDLQEEDQRQFNSIDNNFAQQIIINTNNDPRNINYLNQQLSSNSSHNNNTENNYLDLSKNISKKGITPIIKKKSNFNFKQNSVIKEEPSLQNSKVKNINNQQKYNQFVEVDDNQNPQQIINNQEKNQEQEPEIIKYVQDIQIDDNELIDEDDDDIINFDSDNDEDKSYQTQQSLTQSQQRNINIINPKPQYQRPKMNLSRKMDSYKSTNNEAKAFSVNKNVNNFMEFNSTGSNKNNNFNSNSNNNNNNFNNFNSNSNNNNNNFNNFNSNSNKNNFMNNNNNFNSNSSNPNNKFGSISNKQQIFNSNSSQNLNLKRQSNQFGSNTSGNYNFNNINSNKFNSNKQFNSNSSNNSNRNENFPQFNNLIQQNNNQNLQQTQQSQQQNGIKRPQMQLIKRPSMKLKPQPSTFSDIDNNQGFLLKRESSTYNNY